VAIAGLVRGNLQIGQIFLSVGIGSPPKALFGGSGLGGNRDVVCLNRGSLVHHSKNLKKKPQLVTNIVNNPKNC